MFILSRLPTTATDGHHHPTISPHHYDSHRQPPPRTTHHLLTTNHHLSPLTTTSTHPTTTTTSHLGLSSVRSHLSTPTPHPNDNNEPCSHLFSPIHTHYDDDKPPRLIVGSFLLVHTNNNTPMVTMSHVGLSFVCSCWSTPTTMIHLGLLFILPGHHFTTTSTTMAGRDGDNRAQDASAS